MKTKQMILAAIIAAGFAACKKDNNPVIVVPPSSGAEKITFNGIAAGESGSVAGNAVYLDLSTNKTTEVLRSGWDLGFSNGTDFRVILNNTSAAGVKVLSKFNLAEVNATDTIGLTLAVNHSEPLPSDFAYFDDINGNLSKTAIPEIYASENSNPIIILNRGTGGGIAARPWIKLKISRASNGYVIQYAEIKETTFKSLTIPKNSDFNFTFFSIDKGIVNVEPEKAKWDLQWSYSVFQTSFGAGLVPYNFSDLISVNYLAGVEVKEKIYADAATALSAYEAFNKDSVAKNSTVAGRWTIGSNWRSTMPATGARQDRFYLIKDAQGNYYKFKALSMGVGTDGGTRGKPEFKYSLINP